jgi:hypothetical protein
VGGLVGRCASSRPIAIVDSFWDRQASGCAGSQGGTGLDTSQMQTLSTYLSAGWDIADATDGNSVWLMETSPAYPRLAWEAGFPPSYGGGSGEPNNPYLIYTAAQLDAVGTNVSHWDRCFRLMSDIDLVAYKGNRFHLIGLGASYWGFEGVFDGNGRTISNFVYTSPHEDNVGLFKNLVGQIVNLGLIDPNVMGGTCVGALVGCGGGLTGCYAKGAVVLGQDAVGGLAGYCTSASNCYTTGRVEGGQGVGGLVGMSGGDGIVRSFANADVSGQMDVGGLVGYSSPSVQDCYSRGSVSGEYQVGGLVGFAAGGISKCYAAARTVGENEAGGLAGFASSAWQCFWDIQATGQATSCVGTGLTSDQMRKAETYVNAYWDFVGEAQNGTEDIWWIAEGQDYPRFGWECISTDPAAGP